MQGVAGIFPACDPRLGFLKVAPRGEIPRPSVLTVIRLVLFLLAMRVRMSLWKKIENTMITRFGLSFLLCCERK